MKGTPLTEEIYEYIVQHFAMKERELLERMSTRAKAANMPMIMIGEEQAKFIGFFLKAIGAKRALDVGTLFGYSAAVMSRAMGPGSEVISLEFKEEHAKIARENLEELFLRNVRIQTGPALEAMKLMRRNSFDFILIDADKPNYVNYLNEALRLIKPGGVIAGDNALAWGRVAQTVAPKSDDSENVIGIQKFNDAMAAEKSLFSVIVPIGDGMAMGVVQK